MAKLKAKLMVATAIVMVNKQDKWGIMSNNSSGNHHGLMMVSDSESLWRRRCLVVPMSNVLPWYHVGVLPSVELIASGSTEQPKDWSMTAPNALLSIGDCESPHHDGVILSDFPVLLVSGDKSRFAKVVVMENLLHPLRRLLLIRISLEVTAC